MKPQAPAAQVGLPCAGTAQTLPQALQLAGSLVTSEQAPPHFLKPASQAKPHTLAAHVGWAWAGAAQALAQLPQ